MLLNQPQSKLGQIVKIVSISLTGRPTTGMLKLSAALHTAHPNLAYLVLFYALFVQWSIFPLTNIFNALEKLLFALTLCFFVYNM